jgi:hypothetical protein
MNTPTIKKLALLAALPAAILAANSAMAGVEVYGKVNVSMQQESADTDNGGVSAAAPAVQNGDIYDSSAWESNASRFGIKGSTDLGDTGLKAVAKIEYEVFVDDGVDGSSGDELKQRNIYGGLQGGFGTVIAGKFDTPMKESQGKVDLFNDYILGDINSVLLVGENRADNIVMYSTPKMESGFGAHLALMNGEDSGVDTVSGSYTENNSIGDFVSASVNFETDSLYLALAHDTGSAATSVAPAAATTLAQIAGQTAGAEISRFVAQWKPVNALALGVIYQTADSAENNNTNGADAIGVFGGSKAPFGSTANWSQAFDEQDGYILSAQYTLQDTHVFKLQYGMSEANAIDQTATGTVTLQPSWNVTSADGGDDIEISLLSIGYDYKLDKKSKLYAYYSDYQAEQQDELNAKREINADTFGVGYEYSF